ncbi:MAG: MaoC family dehydratase N-terminal domain-containing protein [Xanthobacteraceae bacterium]
MGNAAAASNTQSEPGWDQLNVGLRVGPLTYEVTQEMVSAFCDAMPFEADPYLDGALDAKGVMPPTMLATDYIPLLKGHLHLGWGLMSRHSIRSLKPVRIGDTVTVTGTITDKFEKKGRHYWTLEYFVSNASGERCLESTITCSVD